MKTIILLLFLTLLFSCSHSIKIKTGSNRFLSSESQGKLGKGKLELFLIQGNTATLDLRNEKTDNSLAMTRESSSISDIGLAGEVGIWGPIDVFHVSGGNMGSDLSGLKVQILGEKRVNAKINNFSVSVFTGYGKVINNVEEGEDFELTPLNDDTSSEMTITNQSTGLLVGYRPEEKIQVTLGYQIALHNFSGILESENLNLNGKSVNYRAQSNLTTLSTHFILTESTFINLEFASDQLNWDKTNTVHNVFTNLAYGFNW